MVNNTATLLAEWKRILDTGRVTANGKAAEIVRRDPEKRIDRISGQPVIYDRFSFQRQRQIQKRLVDQLPQHKDLILSVPALSGHPWKILDYIELYFNHYEIIVKKLKEITSHAQKT
jgi:hypothetical protein